MMPSLSAHQSNDYTKLLIEGDSGTGKTGALASLVAAGYRLRILDFDNGLDVLKSYVLRDCPDKIDNVEFVTLRDKMRASDTGPVMAGMPTAFATACKLLDRWKYTDDNGQLVDLGVPAKWGPSTIVVVDSLTFMAQAAYNYSEMKIVSSARDGKFDNRAIFYDAQKAVASTLALLTAKNFACNVIVISHIKYVDNPDGTKKGYPTSVGSAQAPQIPSYFNSVALCQSVGGKRTIQTATTAMIDLKNPKPFAMAATYDLGTGLAKFFEVLRGSPTAPEPAEVEEAPEAEVTVAPVNPAIASAVGLAGGTIPTIPARRR